MFPYTCINPKTAPRVTLEGANPQNSLLARTDNGFGNFRPYSLAGGFGASLPGDGRSIRG